ncbi:MAG TPA: response regulator [Gemmatimonadaceae bacterium]|nr:response regulator [Gemmatimonadaceae bacterium]
MKKVLVVDDSATMRRMIMASLSGLQGIEFEQAVSGLEAIERLTLTRMDLVVLDLNMPDVHGLEVLKFVRAQPSLGQVPIIVLTTRGDDDSRAAALMHGASLYLTKPFDPRALAPEVERLLMQGTPA